MTTLDDSPSGLDLQWVDAAVSPGDDLFRHVNGRWLDEHQIPADRSIDGAFHVLRDNAEAHVRQIVEESAGQPGDPIGDLYASFMDTTRIERLGLTPISGRLAAIDAIGDTTTFAATLGELARDGIGGLFGFYVDTDAKQSDRYLVHIVQSGLGLPDESYYREDKHATTRAAYRTHVERMFTLAGIDDAAAKAATVLDVETSLAAHHWDVVRRRDAQATYNLHSYDEFAAAATGFDIDAWVAAVTGDGSTLRQAQGAGDQAQGTGDQTQGAGERAQGTGDQTQGTGDQTQGAGERAQGTGDQTQGAGERAQGAGGKAQASDGNGHRAFAEVNVGQPSYLRAAAHLVAQRPLDEWKTWLAWRLLHATAPYLSSALVDENFAFYGTTLSGAPENRDRWKRGVGFVEEAMGFAVGEKYVARHFPPAAKARMDELIANLIEAYRRNITDLEWMTPATRGRALAKLDKFTPKIGYPATSRDYRALVVDRHDLVGNVGRSAAFETDRELAKIGRPVDREEWFMTPQTVNAYYNPGMNEIVFPAAILQPPFFDAGADDAANYGGIGAVIGHEIGHGFDDQGAKYDGDGNLVDWWTDDDRAEFGKRTAALAAQYGQYTPLGLGDEYQVNGEFTLGENIGDLGGLSIALVAYDIAREAANPAQPGAAATSASPVELVETIDGLTGEQRVFFSWAQIWRTKTRDEEAIRRLSVDPHSPPEFRCNGVVRNLDSFYDAFDIDESAALYLAPADRVRIW